MKLKTMSSKLRLLAWILFSLLISSFAEEINITGTVLNETYKPLFGAEVYLIGKNITTITDSVGNFKLSSDLLPVRTGLKQKISPLVALHGCTIDVTLTSSSPIEVTIYGINGRKVYNLTTGMNDAGVKKLAIPIETWGAGVYMITVACQKQVHSFMYTYSDQFHAGHLGSTKTKANESTLLYRSAEIPIDTIIVNAQGYRTYTYLISTFIQSNISITLTPANFDNTTPSYPVITDTGASGNVTTYGSVSAPSTSSGGACNCESTGILYYAAINVNQKPDDNLGQWQNGKACGKCAKVQALTKDGYRSTIVRIMDKCADEYCGIDLGGAPARDLMGTQPGRYSGEWEWVSCAGVEGVSDGPAVLHVKTGSSTYWSRIQVRNGDGGVTGIRVRKAGTTQWEELTWDTTIENYFIVPTNLSQDNGDWEIEVRWDFGSGITVTVPGQALSISDTNILLKQ
jgi:expansin (peptidoglycan-binding protein)